MSNGVTGSANSVSGQPQFPCGPNDGLQYEFFFGDRFVEIRLIKTGSLDFSGAWMFDGKAQELFSSFQPLERRQGARNLDVTSEHLHAEANEKGGSITITSSVAKLKIDFTSPINSVWGFPPSDTVIHQPLLKAKINFGGESLQGVGYCKRYWFEKQVRYWNWRFIMGVIQQPQNPMMVWTADANFAMQKYAYFKIATGDGTILAADANASTHRDTEAFGTINGAPCAVRVRELGRWEKTLKSPTMDTLLRLKFCELTLDQAGKTYTGYALHEIGAGTAD